MSDKPDRNEKGHFLPGNKMRRKPRIESGILKALKENRSEMLYWISKLGSMTLDEVNDMASNPGKLTNIQVMAMKVWDSLKKDPTVPMLGFVFSVHGHSIEKHQKNVEEAILEGSGEKSEQRKVVFVTPEIDKDGIISIPYKIKSVET